MTKNGTETGIVEDARRQPADVLAADANALGIIERRLTALLEQRQRIAQTLQQLAAEDVGCQGAIATLEAIRAEMVEAPEGQEEETS